MGSNEARTTHGLNAKPPGIVKICRTPRSPTRIQARQRRSSPACARLSGHDSLKNMPQLHERPGQIMIKWTTEEIAKRSTEEVKLLRHNAAKLGKQEIVDLCDAELSRRKPAPIKRARLAGADEDRAGHYVSEFHFVCPNELGVTRNQDGSIWTGTWVVATANAEAALKYGSHVALHATKAEQSYLQGSIKGWRKSPRESRYAEDQLVKTEFGIDFLLEPTHSPMMWKGEGAGEKGYAWTPIPLASQK